MFGVTKGRPDRIRFWIVTLALVALLAPVARSSVFLNHAWPFPKPIVARGDYDTVMDTQGHARIASIYIGLAARDIAARHVDEVIAPPDLESIVSRTGDEFMGDEKSAIYPSFITQAAGGLIERVDYDPVLSADELDDLMAIGTVTEYPRDVIAIAADEPDPTVVLFTDSGRQIVYAVAASLAPRGVR